MNNSASGRIDALENAFIILAEFLAERGFIDANTLRDLLSRRAQRFKTDHGTVADPLGTERALNLIATEIRGTTQWLRREHD
jgi:hypothetical protein